MTIIIYRSVHKRRYHYINKLSSSWRCCFRRFFHRQRRACVVTKCPPRRFPDDVTPPSAATSCVDHLLLGQLVGMVGWPISVIIIVRLSSSSSRLITSMFVRSLILQIAFLFSATKNIYIYIYKSRSHYLFSIYNSKAYFRHGRMASVSDLRM